MNQRTEQARDALRQNAEWAKRARRQAEGDGLDWLRMTETERETYVLMTPRPR